MPGAVVDPYSLLPAIALMGRAEEAEKTTRVSEGTGAMIAYQRMMYRGLDTVAMVLIWEYRQRLL